MTGERPLAYDGVMVSSTFLELELHRAALMRALTAHRLHPVAMEDDAALPAETLIDSSLRKVREAAAYVLIIGHRYGNVQVSARNPENLSLTELEYREARRLGRPMLLFVMGDDHPVRHGDIDVDEERAAKLERFREEAKRAAADSGEHRICHEFNDLHEFEVAATKSVTALRDHLGRTSPGTGKVRRAKRSMDGIPSPPALYAEPPYIGSHPFVGRAEEIRRLDDWAAGSEPLLLVEAIGGNGKSMLTWHWTRNHAVAARPDWAGTFWYSFYEKGAVMADFCRRALAYMTGDSLAELNRARQREVTERLIRHLNAEPWLLVLDGLERVLVAYNRWDAAQLADEEAGLSDEIAERDPCVAIRPEDDDLLRQMAGADPSKILVTSRLVPRALLNNAGLAIPGVVHHRLLGLQPADAEKLLRGCRIDGDSAAIQAFLKRHCECHPLVVGVLGGLVNDYIFARGDFDAWSADPDAGGRLDVGELDIVQKRNHILATAFATLPVRSRELLSTLALLSDAADSKILLELNPHAGSWNARHKLVKTVKDLESRGLLQYDADPPRYDLHPVVRAVAVSRLGGAEADRLGQGVVDYFSREARPYEQAETVDDLRDGLTVVRTLIRMGRYSAAADAYAGPLAQALHWKLEANAELLTLLRKFFGPDWTTAADGVDTLTFSAMSAAADLAFRHLGDHQQALRVGMAGLAVSLESGNLPYARMTMGNVALTLWQMNRLARSMAWRRLMSDLAGAMRNASDHRFAARVDLFAALAELGREEEAEQLWNTIRRKPRRLPISMYRPGDMEAPRVKFLLQNDALDGKYLAKVEVTAAVAGNRPAVRLLHFLRGQWLIGRTDWASAADSFGSAVRMAREAGLTDAASECWLALAQMRLGRLPDPRHEITRLSGLAEGDQFALARLWQLLGETKPAIDHAVNAYTWAWADGEPYVHRYELRRALTLLRRLGADVPALSAYDERRDPPDPLESTAADLIAAIRKGSRDIADRWR